MVPNNIICKRIDAGAIMLVLFGLIAGLWANEVRSPDSGGAAAPTRVLHFPQDQSVGVVYLQDENLVGYKNSYLGSQWLRTLSIRWSRYISTTFYTATASTTVLETSLE